MEPPQEHKVVFLGACRAGKSSLIESHYGEPFRAVYEETIGVSLHRTVVNVGLREVSLILVDVSGNLRFLSLAAPYINAAAAIVYVFDFTERASFAALDKIAASTTADVPRFLVGTKIDMLDLPPRIGAAPYVTAAEAQQKAHQLRAKLVTCSSYTGMNVPLLFSLAAKAVSEAAASGRASPMLRGYAPRRSSASSGGTRGSLDSIAETPAGSYHPFAASPADARYPATISPTAGAADDDARSCLVSLAAAWVGMVKSLVEHCQLADPAASPQPETIEMQARAQPAAQPPPPPPRVLHTSSILYNVQEPAV